MMLVEQVLSSGDVVTHSTGAPGEAVISFPAKLHAMLEDSESQGFQDIVAWQPGGKSFKVYNQQRFSSEIMSQYFNQTKYKSFQRQLNIYGFRRIHSGESRGGYVCPSILSEGSSFLLQERCSSTSSTKESH